MSDALSTLLIAAGGLVASKELITKLLGPTAEYLGDGTKDLVKKGAENLTRILRSSCEKLKGDLDKRGQVNPRVLKNVWDEGRFVEDVFSAELLGGVLASARTEDGRDDSAVPLVALVKSLSSYQIRLHFIIYYLCSRRPPVPGEEWKAMASGSDLRIPGSELLRAMDLEGSEGESQLVLALTGLVDQRLLGQNFAFRFGLLQRNRGGPAIEEEGIAVRPNDRGATLFLRALGLRGLVPEVITSVNVDYGLSESMKPLVGSMPRNATYNPCLHQSGLNSLREEVEDRLFDLENVLDDVKDELAHLRETVDRDEDEAE